MTSLVLPKGFANCFELGLEIIGDHRATGGAFELKDLAPGLYRVSAPKGTRVRGSAQLSGATVPLRIATTPVSRATGCTELVDRVICAVAEQACPMPPGLWRFRFEKLDGPAAEVRVEFEVDTRQPSGRVE